MNEDDIRSFKLNDKVAYIGIDERYFGKIGTVVNIYPRFKRYKDCYYIICWDIKSRLEYFNIGDLILVKLNR